MISFFYKKLCKHKYNYDFKFSNLKFNNISCWSRNVYKVYECKCNYCDNKIYVFRHFYSYCSPSYYDNELLTEKIKDNEKLKEINIIEKYYIYKNLKD